MRADHKVFSIDDRAAATISAYCRIANTNGSLITLAELATLVGDGVTAIDLEMAWPRHKDLDSTYCIRSGFIFPREIVNDGLGLGLIEREVGRRQRAGTNLVAAGELARVCNSSLLQLMAVAGSTAYRTPGATDDIDIFCVTTANSLWIFMFKSLVMARLLRSRSGTPPFCFSYVTEEAFAFREFRRSRDGIFARDALMAQVMVGDDFYKELLRESRWMSRYFPQLYLNKTTNGVSRVVSSPRRATRSGNRTLNWLLYLTLGTYVRTKAHLLNRRYRKEGKMLSVFEARVGIDHCVYESNRYRNLRSMYSFVEER